MRLARRFIVCSIMTCLLLAPTAAHADLGDEEYLFARATAENWGPEEWAEFQRWVDWVCLVDIIDRANAGDHAAVEQLIWLVFGADAPRALQVAWRESRYQADARNRSGASGLFQLMLPLHARRFTNAGFSPDQWSDAGVNITVAYQLFQEQGWKPWAV